MPMEASLKALPLGRSTAAPVFRQRDASGMSDVMQMSAAAWLGTLLAYGTTGRAARRFGAGDRAGAVAEGVQASWVALTALGKTISGMSEGSVVTVYERGNDHTTAAHTLTSGEPKDP